MPKWKDLPTRDQIDAIEDAGALRDIRNEVDKAVAQIETELEFRDRDDEWYERAMNALKLHKYVDTLLSRRIREIEKRAKKEAKKAPARFREDYHDLTEKALAGDVIDPADVPASIPAIEAALADIMRMQNAVNDDRADEMLSFSVDERDAGWLTATKLALKRIGAVRVTLQDRLNALRREARIAAANEAQNARAVAFVRTAKALLDAETYARIWAIADQSAATEGAPA